MPRHLDQARREGIASDAVLRCSAGEPWAGIAADYGISRAPARWLARASNPVEFR